MKKLILILLSFLIIFQLSACQSQKKSFKKEISNKKVIMIIVDSLTDSLIVNNLEEQGLPALEFLMKNGQYYNDLVTPFPSMSVTIEASLMTGSMPNKHKIPGLSWYSKDNNQLINYGSSMEIILKQGVFQTMENSLSHLNQLHLSKKTSTIFEELDRHSLTSGAVNTLVYRGNYPHDLNLPFGTDHLSGKIKDLKVMGPGTLALGRLTIPKIIEGKQYSDTAFEKFGFNDQFSSEIAKALINEKAQPDFMLLYFPNMDKEAHKHGPNNHLELIKVDQYIADIMMSFGSFKKALEQNIFIIMGDHGSSQLLDGSKKTVSVDLHELFSNYTVASVDEVTSDDDIAFGNNHRMSYVYPLKEPKIIPKLALIAKQDQRIDIIAYSDNQWIHVLSPDYSTSFKFKKGGNWEDHYGQRWTINGDHQILSLQLSNHNAIKYTSYPDVLNQLYSALYSHDMPKLIITAKPNYALYSEGIAIHTGGGEHGGLHEDDLLTSIIISGTKDKPKTMRTIELKEFIIKTLLKEN